MTMFWAAAALFIAGALLMLLPSLLGPQPARRTALGVALLLGLGAPALTLTLGHPSAAGRHDDPVQAVDTLLARLRAEPASAPGWVTLARGYLQFGRYRDAALALRRASDLMPGNAGLLADLADVLGAAQGKRLAGEPARLIQRALDIDPNHPKALALAATVSFEAQDYAAARSHWERLLVRLPADSPTAVSVKGSIAEATQLAGDAPAAAAVASLTGSVGIAPALASRIAPGDTLFVFARAAQGPRMPLAILRVPVPALPFAFKLDDTMAMSPALKLSAFPQVVVGARISRSGNATPQSGDLVGQSEAVTPGTQGLQVTIDRVQP